MATADEVTAELAATLARYTALALAPDADDAIEDAVRIDAGCHARILAEERG